MVRLAPTWLATERQRFTTGEFGRALADPTKFHAAMAGAPATLLHPTTGVIQAVVGSPTVAIEAADGASPFGAGAPARVAACVAAPTSARLW